jgi:hypothetical protein
MSDSLVVRPLSKSWVEDRYDVAIGTVGYEQRARYVFENIGARGASCVACGFSDQRVLAYDDNSRWFESHGFRVDHKPDSEYAGWLSNAFNLTSERASLRVLVDISSMTRVRLARLIEFFTSQAVERPIVATFVYSLAAYTAPPEAALYNSHVGPVTPMFAGWWEEPDRASAAIVGLGYEEDKALGAVEHLQSSYVWLFVPSSEIAEYSDALARANKTLLDSVPSARTLQYRVHDPYSSFVKLESLVYGVSRTHNAVLLPFGPKLFALSALLVAAQHRNVAVWRVSAEGLEPAVDRSASGFVYGLEVEFPSPELVLTELEF